MPTAQSDLLLRHVRRLAAPAPPPSDRELLRRFADRRDEDAFATLVGRHGPMVYRTAQRVLHSGPDAEDVFQATFLVLARKAGALAWQASIGPWLYQAARRLALEAKSAAARRQERERESCAGPRAAADPLAELSVREAQAIFDEELTRLPERLRAPLVLCHLEGATQDEAARQLGLSLGTLKRRLEQGRGLLRARLTRRGLGLSAALMAAMLTPVAATAALPAPLAQAAVTAGLQASVPARVLALAQTF